MPPSDPQARAGDGGRAAGLPRLDVSLAESEYREQRHSHRRQQSLQSLHAGGPGGNNNNNNSPLPSPLSPAFSRDDRPPPPYLASMPSSPAYSHASFAPLDPAQKQELLGGGGGGGGDTASPRQASPTYLSPYGGGGGASPGGGGGGSGYSNSTEWIPMQRPLPPLGAVAAAQSKRRRRLRMVAFCIAPLLLFILVGVLVIVMGIVRPSTKPA
ncbi:hypothetical protein RB594_005037 [Gaeumannomyces avenae]